MALTVNFSDQLDFNHNGWIDNNERLAQTGSSVADAFTGIGPSGLNTYSTDANAVIVIPEPAAISLILGAGVAMLAARRYWSARA